LSIADSSAVDKNADVAPLNRDQSSLIDNSLPGKPNRNFTILFTALDIKFHANGFNATAWYKCRTCGNKDIEKAKISNPLDKNFGREYYGCFLRPPIGQCTRPKPFLFWAPNESSAKKRKQTETEQNKNSKQKTIHSYFYGMY